MGEAQGSGVGRRQFLGGLAGIAGAMWLVGCTDGESSDGAVKGKDVSNAEPVTAATALAAPGSAGLVDEDAYQARVDEYLKGATAELDPSELSSIVASLIAAHRDPGFAWDPSAVTVDSLQERWDQIDGWEDTRDFTFNYLHWVLALADGKRPATTIDPKVIDAIEQRMVDARYRYDDPYPEDRVDEQWYWSENHMLILSVDEYLAGQRMPDRTFTITKKTGAEHMERAKERILEWVAERLRFGFFEWHSTTYMRKNIEPLGTLVQWADDPELVRAAAVGMDLCLLDVAGQTQRGFVTATQGRAYGFGGSAAPDGGTNVIRLVFDSPLPFTGGSDHATNHLAGGTRYRPPQVLAEVAANAQPGVTRERHGIFVDGTAPVTDDVEAPFGYDFDDPDKLEFWWSQGAVGLWQMGRINLAEAKAHRLFESKQLAPIKLIVDLNGGDAEKLRPWLRENHAAVNFGHLREANTYTWRGPHGSMSSVLDHRFGQMRDQIRTWQARLGTGHVFTQHPADAPSGDGTSEKGKPGYWTGEASIPRSAQHERTSVHVYQPAWDATNVDPLLWSVLGYQDETHAFVPQDRFDAVVRDGHWTFAREGDGYLGLWSWREVDWRDHGPAEDPDEGFEKPFDLVAEGGADNVWICELGDADESGTFEEFQAACTAGKPTVERGDDGFDVSWTSPSAGEIVFGSTATFTVDGKEVAQADFPRHESNWGTIDHLATTADLKGDKATLHLEAKGFHRQISAR
jgi:hypothetical protein